MHLVVPGQVYHYHCIKDCVSNQKGFCLVISNEKKHKCRNDDGNCDVWNKHVAYFHPLTPDANNVAAYCSLSTFQDKILMP
jgi:hypothetical protein